MNDGGARALSDGTGLAADGGELNAELVCTLACIVLASSPQLVGLARNCRAPAVDLRSASFEGHFAAADRVRNLDVLVAVRARDAGLVARGDNLEVAVLLTDDGLGDLVCDASGADGLAAALVVVELV